MDSNTIIGIVVMGGITIVGFLWKYEERIKADQKARNAEIQKYVETANKLNESIIRMTERMDQILKNDEIRDKRITTHGIEIDKNKLNLQEVNNKVNNLEKAVDRHEIAIGNLREVAFNKIKE